MTQLLMKDIKFDFSDDCKTSFNILKEKLTTAPIITSPDWNVPFELMCDIIEFVEGSIKDKKAAENLAADHLSRLENPDLGTFTEEEITDEFPNEHLMILKAKLNNDEPWYADYVNYIVGKIMCSDKVMRRCVAGNEILEILAHCHSGLTGGHHSASITGRKVYESRFYWPSIFKDATENLVADHLSRLETLNLGTFMEDEIADESSNDIKGQAK
ncbi:hypothetical protein Tco_1430893 [Tanacetum coccineum]